MSDEGKKFHVTFRIQAHPDGVPEGDMADGSCGCDSLVQIVMVHDRDSGTKSYQVMSMDGERNEPLMLFEQWEAWYVMGRSLSQLMDPNDDTHGWKQQVAEGLIEVCQAMRKDGKKKIDSGILDPRGRKIFN